MFGFAKRKRAYRAAVLTERDCQVFAVALPRDASVVHVTRSLETWILKESAEPVWENRHLILPIDRLAPRSNQTLAEVGGVVTVVCQLVVVLPSYA